MTKQLKGKIARGCIKLGPQKPIRLRRGPVKIRSAPDDLIDSTSTTLIYVTYDQRVNLIVHRKPYSTLILILILTIKE